MRTWQKQWREGGKEKAEKNDLVSPKKRKPSSEGRKKQTESPESSKLGAGETGWPRVGLLKCFKEGSGGRWARGWRKVFSRAEMGVRREGY